jgi:hypothetical protein
MAQKRMFCRDITNSDAFTEMPLSAQALYFHLGLAADVKGFITPKGTMRLINANVDDLKTLVAKQFVIPFDSGVVVITHWNVHNNIREDREAKTIYQKELAQIENCAGEYQLPDNSRRTPAQIRLDQIRLDQVRLDTKYHPSNEEGAKPAAEYGNPEINECVSFLKAQLDGELDDSAAANRRWCKLLLDKLHKTYSDTSPVDNVKALIIAARKDKFHKRNATSFRYFFYNAQRIIQSQKSSNGIVAII